MSVKQFGHFLSLQQQLAGLRRGTRRTTKAPARVNRRSDTAVLAAKDWLAAAGRNR
jgi:hypothetical protein